MSTLLIVGCGMLGTSVARAARSRDQVARIIGVDPDPIAREQAQALGSYDSVFDSLSGLAAQTASLDRSDTVGIAATPPAQLAAAMHALAGHCDLVLDVGSIKAQVATDLTAAGPVPPGIVPCHPMAGSHRQGPTAGDADLFAGRWVFVVPMSSSSTVAVQRAHQFWQALGAQTTDIEAAEHDLAVAYTSHLPHLLASGYVAAGASPLVAAAGTGYMEFTRLAKANPQMWSQVLSANATAVQDLLDDYIDSLQQVSSLLADGDVAALEQWLAQQKDARERIQQRLEQ